METSSSEKSLHYNLSQYLHSAVYAELPKTPHQTRLSVQSPAYEVEWPCND